MIDAEFTRFDNDSIAAVDSSARCAKLRRRESMREKLKSYQTLRNRISQLKSLLTQVERDAVLGSIGAARLNPAPARSIGRINDPVSAPAIRIDEIRERLEQQQVEAQNALYDILCAIDHLPPDSQERDVIELHYLHGKSLIEIERLRFISQATIVRAEARGIDELLESAEVCRTFNIDQL